MTSTMLPLDLPGAAMPALVNYERFVTCRPKWRWVDIDSAVVLRFVDGEHDLALNAHERFACYVLLRLRGVSANGCARLLRLSWSSQARYRRLFHGNDADGIAGRRPL